LIKTLAKPLTTRLKKEAKRFKSFSTFCIGAGQLTHQVSSRFTALAQGYRVKEINPLPEEDALARGISFVSESFLFLVAGGIIVIEFNRSEEKNAIKAEAAKRKEEEFRQYLEERFAAIDRRVHEMEERLNKIEADKEKSILPSVLFPESFSSKAGLKKKNPYSHHGSNNSDNQKHADNEEPPIYESLWQWGVNFLSSKPTSDQEDEPTGQSSPSIETSNPPPSPSPSITQGAPVQGPVQTSVQGPVQEVQKGTHLSQK
jgi:hypothetical protein